MPGYGMKKKPMMKNGGKVKRKNYGHGGGAMVITISKVKPIEDDAIKTEE